MPRLTDEEIEYLKADHERTPYMYVTDFSRLFSTIDALKQECDAATAAATAAAYEVASQHRMLPGLAETFCTCEIPKQRVDIHGDSAHAMPDEAKYRDALRRRCNLEQEPESDFRWYFEEGWQSALSMRDAELADLRGTVAQRDGQIRDLNSELQEHATDRVNQRKEVSEVRKQLAARDQVIAECWKLVYHWRGRSLPLMLCADELAAILPKEK